MHLGGRRRHLYCHSSWTVSWTWPPRSGWCCGDRRGPAYHYYLHYVGPAISKGASSSTSSDCLCFSLTCGGTAPLFDLCWGLRRAHLDRPNIRSVAGCARHRPRGMLQKLTSRGPITTASRPGGSCRPTLQNWPVSARGFQAAP